MYIDTNNTALGSSVLSETHYWPQAIDSHNTRIIFDEQETGQRSKTSMVILQSLKKQSTFDR